MVSIPLSMADHRTLDRCHFNISDLSPHLTLDFLLLLQEVSCVKLAFFVSLGAQEGHFAGENGRLLG